MKQRIDITICLGSSCFSRGNGKTMATIKSYLKEHGLESKTFFHGELCTGNCAKGPVLKINDRLYENVDPTNIIDILNDLFLD